MSLPTTAPASKQARATDARQVSTDSGRSKRARSASMAGTTRSSSCCLGDLLAGAGLHPADVEEVGAVGHEPLGLAQERVERVVGALVVERVGRAVEDAHHDGPVGDVEAVGPEREVHGGNLHRPPEPLPGRRRLRRRRPARRAAAPVVDAVADDLDRRLGARRRR